MKDLCNMQVFSNLHQFLREKPKEMDNKIEDPSVLYAGKDYNLSKPIEPKGSPKILGP